MNAAAYGLTWRRVKLAATDQQTANTTSSRSNGTFLLKLRSTKACLLIVFMSLNNF